MKRKPSIRKGPATTILTADLHLTSISPVSRTDDYIQAQEKKLNFLTTLSAENGDCPILCAGDVFDYWKASPWLCSWAYRNLPKNLITIPGNHDLPMHSMDQYDKSALHLLEQVGQEITVLNEEWQFAEGINILGIPFNTSIGDFRERKNPGERRILMLHALTWENQKPHWASYSYTAGELLKQYGEYFDVILVGDNHQSFVVHSEKHNCVLVNPGSMLRRTADQKDFKPRCFLYYAEDNSVVPMYFPIEEEVHDIRYLENKQEHNARIEAYISRMNKEYEIGISFKDNLVSFFEENQTPKKVRDIVWQHLEPGKILG